VYISVFIIIVYFILLCLLAVFGGHRYYLSYLFLKYKNNNKKPFTQFKDLPFVTIQLPMYNEMNVAARLIDHVVEMDYPQDRMEIQVLDDSTDQTCSIARERVEFYRKKRFNIFYIHRDERKGYKAGALDNGMNVAKGEFFAVFDADFVPEKDFLRKTIHYFTEPGIGMIQVRWSHLNKEFSLLTKLQSIFLDGHFVIEHTARNRSGRFFNFNGTAGIWRKEAIQTSEGWQHDTLTEDLDLSYRAQMKGWKFIYLPYYAIPAELPTDIIAFKTQQHRWAKGSIQTTKKLISKIFKSEFPLKVKVEAFFHLAGNFNYLIMIPLSLSILPLVIIRVNMQWERTIILDIPLFLLATGSLSAFYLISQKELYQNWGQTFKYLPLLMGLGIGLSVNNATAVIEALINKQSEFVRTPKLGVEKLGEVSKHKKYRANRNKLIPLMELLLGVYFTITVIISIRNELWLTLPFLILFQYGYLFMAFLSFRSILKK
jgi:cellulose synthase/poly-beta-1,6-N-acetylglucosamine synthase-like glycosyltransferase